MNENTSNNSDTSAIIEELQILNQGTISNGEKLDQVIEYLITKEEKEQEEKESTKEQEEKKDQEEQKATEEQQQNQEEQTETYTELLTDIRDQSVLTNNLLSGQIFFMGILFGIIFLNVLWNRFIR